MKIDLSKLLKGLEALPHMPVPEPENISPYVLTNILAPLKNDDCIHFADLDFEAFTEEDIDSLYVLPRATLESCSSLRLRASSRAHSQCAQSSSFITGSVQSWPRPVITHPQQTKTNNMKL